MWIGSPSFGGIFEPDVLKQRLTELESMMSAPDFWNDPENAHLIPKEKNTIQDQLGWLAARETDIEELGILMDMYRDGESAAAEEIKQKLSDLEAAFSTMETKRMLSDQDDVLSAIVLINSGAGGTEAQDWAEMLFRMYSRWSETKGYHLEVVNLLPGDEAGIKNVTFLVEGKYAYGLMKAENGVHRLIRISPLTRANAGTPRSPLSPYLRRLTRISRSR